MRKSIALFVAALICGCAGPHKPNAKMEKADKSRIATDTSDIFDPFPSATLAADILLEFTRWRVGGIIPEQSWGIIEDVQPANFIRIQELELLSLFKEGESNITSEEMRHRAVVLRGNLGLVDAKYLWEHQADIPVDWQGCYIVFPGTVLRDSLNNDPYVPVLTATYGGGWYLYFSHLDSDWSGSGCVVSVKQ